MFNLKKSLIFKKTKNFFIKIITKIFFACIKKNTSLNKRIVICLTHAAGDFLMASKAINYLIIKTNNEKLFLYERPEVKDLIITIFPKIKSTQIKHITYVKKLKKDDLLINFSGPNQTLTNQVFKKGLKFIGFLYDLKIRTNLKIKINHNYCEKKSNHIRRNNRIIEILFRLEEFDIPDEIFIPKLSSKISKEKAILINFPQEKTFKAYPPNKSKDLIKLISKNYKFKILSYYKDQKTIQTFANFKENFEKFENWKALISTLTKYELIITTDSVVYHMCNGLNLKCIALFGHTSSKFYKTKFSRIKHIDKSDPSKPCYFGCGSNKYGKNNNCNPYCKIINSIKNEDIIKSLKYIIQK
ncbi:glycosyltransferase family 9 protein [uncultured Prochlorococcus sp.]|uniref:glycosyltransferase family 9 protein n=1 Tax=uncultured Prochlorococcus sp. TaxID=159733 RepID=UPI00258A3FE1|nr:glycosyltransferase family 9 protein [uncultured Prochlorococcus sp.]